MFQTMDSLLQLVIATTSLLVLLASVGSINARAIEDLVENNLLQAGHIGIGGDPSEPKDWLKIIEAPPPKVIQALGNSIELECEIMGSPPPTVHWVRGSTPTSIVSLYSPPPAILNRVF